MTVIFIILIVVSLYFTIHPLIQSIQLRKKLQHYYSNNEALLFNLNKLTIDIDLTNNQQMVQYLNDKHDLYSKISDNWLNIHLLFKNRKNYSEQASSALIVHQAYENLKQSQLKRLELFNETK